MSQKYGLVNYLTNLVKVLPPQRIVLRLMKIFHETSQYFDKFDRNSFRCVPRQWKSSDTATLVEIICDLKSYSSYLSIYHICTNQWNKQLRNQKPELQKYRLFWIPTQAEIYPSWAARTSPCTCLDNSPFHWWIVLKKLTHEFWSQFSLNKKNKPSVFSQVAGFDERISNM